MFERKKEYVDVSAVGHVKHSKVTLMLAIRNIINSRAFPTNKRQQPPFYNF